jgi:hypothetical protein
VKSVEAIPAYFELSAHAPQESRVSGSEGVPSEPLLDSEFLRLGTDVLPQNRLTPVRLAAAATVARENPAVEFAVAVILPPFDESLDGERINRNRLL